MSWFGRKKVEPVSDDEASRRGFMMDAVGASIAAADDERYAQMKRIDGDLKRRLDLLRREAELVMQDKDT